MGFDFTGNDYSQLEQHLYDKSYIEGYCPSQADVVVFSAIASSPDVKKYPHSARWWSHIKSWENDHASLPGEKKELSSYGPAKGSTSAPPAAAGDDDDIDLFGSDDEEVDEEAEKIKAARLAEYAAKKANKPKTIAKSLVTLDVKPWDDETDMAELEKSVRSVEMDGLVSEVMLHVGDLDRHPACGDFSVIMSPRWKLSLLTGRYSRHPKRLIRIYFLL